MVFHKVLTVKYITSKNCFCSLSLNNLRQLQGVSITPSDLNDFIDLLYLYPKNCIKIIYNDVKEAYFSIESAVSITNDNGIAINSQYAKVLGIADSSIVTVIEVPKPPTISSVTISAVSGDDHEVLELLAENVQSTLLNQVRLLVNDQQILVRVGNSLNVAVDVCDIKPISPGLIDNYTEVTIKPPFADNKLRETDALDAARKKLLEADIFQNFNSISNSIILRVVPYTRLAEKLGSFLQPFNVFALKATFPHTFDESTLTHPQIYTINSINNDHSEPKLIYVRLYFFEEINDGIKINSLSSEDLFVSGEVLEHFGCAIGTRVELQQYYKPIQDVTEIEIHTKRHLPSKIQEKFKRYLADNCHSHEFILNSDIILEISPNVRYFVKFIPCEVKFVSLTQDTLRSVKLLMVNTSLPAKEIVDKNEFCTSKYTTNVSNYQSILENSRFLFLCNDKPRSRMHNIMVTGKSGTGKSTLVNLIRHEISDFPYFIYTKKLKCKTIKGKTIDSLYKLFTATLFELIHHQPSVLILDDLDVLCENLSETDAITQNAIYADRISELLEGLIREFCTYNAVGILATADSTAKLNKAIYTARGNHLFKNTYNIDNLSKNDRVKLLEFFFSAHQLQDIDLETFSKKTEGFVVQDLSDFANKTVFESYQEDPDQSTIKIKLEHCEHALQAVTIASLHNINLHPPGNKDLSDIGGLQHVKQTLIENMMWPSKYENLFSNPPLRLPSGLLLYGAPGTGKTILAGAAARHCDLRLISIKGPELLSKYIGASEQAVRDVFRRAQSARPCVLFFDEFDSLAPRRGHDNTGVTDRVVNQLLTQLDGIESLSGVFVLAATSRPDLLDPALLRPGRLDRHLRCPLPDEKARLDILTALSKSLKFSSDVDLGDVACCSDGYTGADLQAVLYSAQLESVKGLLEDEEINSQEFETIEVDQRQLMDALKSTRPSLNKVELSKFEAIYRKFEGGSVGSFTPGSRATLA